MESSRGGPTQIENVIFLLFLITSDIKRFTNFGSDVIDPGWQFFVDRFHAFYILYEVPTTSWGLLSSLSVSDICSNQNSKLTEGDICCQFIHDIFRISVFKIKASLFIKFVI